jgi:hypothetical protein
MYVKLYSTKHSTKRKKSKGNRPAVFCHFSGYRVSQDLRSRWAPLSQFGSHGLVSYDWRTMKWEKLFGARPQTLPVWAALCTGRADGSNPKYLAHVKHAILAMARASESDAQSTIFALLQSNGWREPEIKNLKLLDHPFHSDDPTMRACHESAITKEGGIVVYSDPIDEA